MKYNLTGIGIVSLGALLGVMNGIFVALFAWPLILFDLAGGGGVGIGVFLLLIIGAMAGGFIAGVVTAVIYNVLFTMIGGLTIELEQADS